MPNHDGTGPREGCNKGTQSDGNCGCGQEHHHRHGPGQTCKQEGNRRQNCLNRGNGQGSGRGNGNGCCSSDSK